MDATNLAREMEERFEGQLQTVTRSSKRVFASVPPERLRELVEWLRGRIDGFRLSTSTGIDLRDGIGVFHHFVVNGMPLVITIKVMASKPKPKLPSLARMIPAALWIEREIHDFLGIEFEDHPDPRRLLKARAFGDDVHPLRRDFDVREFKERIKQLPDF